MSEDRDEERADESREQAGEKSLRPDVQAGALRMAEGNEPERHEHPSYRETSEDAEQDETPER
jgi:hypothetical protein